MDASNLSELRDAAVDYAKQQQNQHDGEPQFLELRSGISRLSSPESGLVAEAKRFAPPIHSSMLWRLSMLILDRAASLIGINAM